MKTSVITFNRNDGYKEPERLAIHLTTLLETFDEVNYVDWNSPTHSALYDVIDEIPKTKRLKHFVISPFIHDQIFKGIEGAPWVSGVLSFNLALRRTNADWITATTLDIIPPFKHELKNFLSDNADFNTFYTFSRREVNYDNIVNNKENLKEYRKLLSSKIPPRYFPAKVTPNDNYSLINCCGDFQIAHKNVWNKIKGFEEQMIFNCYVDTNVQKKAILNGFKLQAIYDIPLYHMSHKNHLPQSSTQEIHKISKKSPKYNDPYKWVEYFSESENLDDWGLNGVEIEYEIF